MKITNRTAISSTAERF